MIKHGSTASFPDEHHLSSMNPLPRQDRSHTKTQSYALNRPKRNTHHKFTSASTVLQINKCLHLSKALCRKNTLSFQKKQNTVSHEEPSLPKDQHKTPFENRKIRDRTKFQNKMKELKQKKRIPYFLEENVKNWLVIQELSTKNLAECGKMGSTMLALEMEDRGRDPAREQNQNPIHSTLHLLQQSMKFDKNLRAKANFYFKCPKSRINYHTLKTSAVQTPEPSQSFHKFVAQNLSSSKNKNSSPKHKNMMSTKVSLSNQRNSKSNNTSKADRIGFEREKRPTLKLKETPPQTDVIKGAKIGICQKASLRPSTAVTKGPPAHFKSKRPEKEVKKDSFMRDVVSGWEDLTDSFQKQIIF